MAYDLLIKNGTVVDGSGMPRYHADVAVNDGKIVHVGRVNGSAEQTIDADGLVVAPGFVDGHTHMDAQIFWDELGASSCYHGVTTAVMGNCGFTLAPCREHEKELVFKSLERAEDMSPAAMEAGIPWSWETFPEYLDAIDKLPKAINYAGYIGHSALRTWVMGERAYHEQASAQDMQAMQAEIRNAMAAGAIGFSTSRTPNHKTSDDQPVASRVANWSEVQQLVATMGQAGGGIFEIAGENTGLDPERIQDYQQRLKALAVDTGCAVTYGMFSSRFAPDHWRSYLDLLDETAADGGRMFMQVHARSLSAVLSFETQTPYDRYDIWKDLRQLPLPEQLARIRNEPGLREKLVQVAQAPFDGPQTAGLEARRPDWDWVYLMTDTTNARDPSMADLARQKGVSPEDILLDLALERDGKFFLRQPIANEEQDHIIEMMKHPRTSVTFSDSGAHVSQVADSSLQTHVLSYWTREKEALTLEDAVRMLTFENASNWGLSDRGLVRPGFAGDLVVFDPDRINARMPEVVADLPAGGQRLLQTSDGIHHVVVGGQETLRDNKPTGKLPGRLVRQRVG